MQQGEMLTLASHPIEIGILNPAHHLELLGITGQPTFLERFQLTNRTLTWSGQDSPVLCAVTQSWETLPLHRRVNPISLLVTKVEGLS